MEFTDIKNPNIGDETIFNGVAYVYDGYGWVQKTDTFKESDPIFNQQKDTFAKKTDLEDYATKGSLEDYATKTNLNDSINSIVFPKYANYVDTLFKADAVYDKDLIRLKQTSQMYDVKNLTVRTSIGDTHPDYKIVYNNGYAWLYCTELSKNSNFEFFTIEYNLVNNTKTYLPDLRGKIGLNFMQDENTGNSYHSRMNAELFRSVYKVLGKNQRTAIESALVEGHDIYYSITDEMAVKYKFNILARPYVDGARSEEISSCPDILTVAPEYGNYYYEGAKEANQHEILNSNPALNVGDRVDITPDANTFLNNTIAITAGQNVDGSGIWCSYGYGTEFFEAFLEFDSLYPSPAYKNFYDAFFSCYVDTDRRTMITKYVGDKRHTVGMGTDVNSRYIGETLWLAYKGTNIEFQVAQIVDDYTIVADRDLPVMTSSETYYVWGYENRLHEIAAGNPEQSPTCSIIAAKLAAIQDWTNANWQLVREAARMTASCSTYTLVNGKKVWTTHWDMKRGFGIINVAEAIQYIKDNYSENQDYKDNAVLNVPKINSLLTLDDLEDDNVVSKRILSKEVDTLNANINNLSDELGSDINNLSDELENKINNLSNELDTTNTTVAGKAPINHSHAISDVTNLQTTLTSLQNGKQDKLTFTPENTANKVTAFQSTPDNNHYPAEKLVKEALDAKSNNGHTHNFSEIENKPTTSDGYGITDVYKKSEVDNNIYKTLNIGTSGLITLSPTTSYFTYRLNVTDNVILNIDLQRMINQIGNARCRLIIDMPIVKTITLTKPILWGGTVQNFASAGQYIFEIIDVDGTGTPLIWQVASTTKVQQTGVILYVDSTSADYSTAQINGETATRTTSTWASPFKYLQNAINAANAGDMIFVKSGTYYPTHLRTTPTSYADGDYQRRDATFTMKTGVDVYGGFLGTESKTWQRVVDSKGFPVNKSILNGDIKREAAIDSAKTIGDLRTDASKLNAAYNVVYANVASYTYLNGFDVKYGNANGSSAPTNQGGGVSNTNTNLVLINCTAYNNSATYGGGWIYGANTNCTAYNNSATSNGGGWAYGTNTNCTAYNNSAPNGGGWILGINTNCTAYNNSASAGGGWKVGTNTNCTAYNNSASNGGGWAYGTNTNCNCINNKGNSCIYIGTDVDITNINCLLINNKTNSNGIATIFGSSSSKIYKFRNNVYDCPNPTLSGGAGSDIDFTSCKPNITLNDVKIDVPSFVDLSANDTQLQELKDFATNIITHLKPKSGSILKGAGINNATYSNPTDFAGIARPANCTVGILEG